jgi:hypothetical protein
MLLDELACLVDHFVDQSFDALGVAVSNQHRYFCRPHAVVGITPRLGPDVLALSKARVRAAGRAPGEAAGIASG